jgi:hypothetical protein
MFKGVFFNRSVGKLEWKKSFRLIWWRRKQQFPKSQHFLWDDGQVWMNSEQRVDDPVPLRSRRVVDWAVALIMVKSQLPPFLESIAVIDGEFEPAHEMGVGWGKACAYRKPTLFISKANNIFVCAITENPVRKRNQPKSL